MTKRRPLCYPYSRWWQKLWMILHGCGRRNIRHDGMGGADCGTCGRMLWVGL
ncbi:MAG: hypothetical protein UZ00_C0013G0002 [Parcubacteria group bacterium GW2011_GWA1_60_11]|nr:MAG: hypothetical protein UZ00_C0013G0002 [Parcubacteria group bacterium GW2011_GWA1_60_11]